ncbi:DUF445 domain-containing protein [Alteribacter aurantiacus]|uniref:DUF445 domain-containing protein n=1 Tax=Alteribacter aurantiacus TaxID=254410 RepID=UPI00042359D2|nr:DUF445 family protein [Alteribacter aurantiacus]
MQTFMLISLMVIIGAFIGGLTNLIAIRMLFRPFNPIKIGSYQVPFTPGLIPKRRGELAEQLGNLVVGHLITVEGVKSKLFDNMLIQEIRTWFKKKVHELSTSSSTLEEWWKGQSGGEWSATKTKGRFTTSVAKTLVKTADEYRGEPLQNWLPESIIHKGETLIPETADLLLEKGKVYVRSHEGKAKIEEMVSRYFSTKGSFGGMVGRVVTNIPISGRIQYELLRLLDDHKSQEFIESQLRREFEELKEKNLDELFPNADWEGRANQIAEEIAKKVPVLGEWDKPMSEWAYRYEAQLVDSLMPAVLETLSSIIERNLQRMLMNLKLDEIVEDQVNSFPLPKLEQVILSIAKKELKMIALLGALIGASVGLVQGLIALMFF